LNVARIAKVASEYAATDTPIDIFVGPRYSKGRRPWQP
jgi:hypothetical protein